MDLINGNLKQIYLKYFFVSLGGSLALPIYGLIDMAMVGKYYGPIGAAAMAIFMPIWTLLFGFGFLAGVGGAVLYANQRGTINDGNLGEANQLFTTSVICSTFFSLVLWFLLIFYDTEILRILGAENELMALCKEYLLPVQVLAPVFGYLQVFTAFLRNDSAPALVTKGVFAGGVFNILGDYLLIFTFDLGMLGAGIATVGGAFVSTLFMASHFWSAKNTLKLIFPRQLFSKAKAIIITGFPTFFIDVALGLLTLIFIRQTLQYLDEDSLAIYGVIVNITVCVRSFAFAVGHASQPLLSVNYGAKQINRVVEVLRYNLITIAIITILCVAVIMAYPVTFIYLFMEPTESVVNLAPFTIRTYSLAYLLLPLNVYFTSFAQAILMPKLSMFTSLLNGIILSGIFLIVFPYFFSPTSLWYAIPAAELCTALVTLSSLWIILKRGVLKK